MLSLEIDKIVELYRAGKSPYELAEIYNTYPNKIRRLLKKHGEPIRDKSKAQSVGIQNGRIPHPTKGKELSDDTKAKISTKVHKYWKSLTEEELAEAAARSKSRWDAMTDLQKKDMQNKAFEAIRLAAKEGSKLEKHLYDVLVSEGFHVQFHRKNLVVNEKLEADLYIPELNTIIEIDGPSHFLPIWGEEKLNQTIKADNDKVGLAISKGFVVVRIKCLADNILERHKRQGAELLLEAVKKLKVKIPPKKNRFIELEINE